MKTGIRSAALILFFTFGISAGPLFLLISDPEQKSSSIEMKGWDESISRNEIFEWAASRKMELLPDAPPFIDNKAFFTGKYGSELIFHNPDRSQKYRLFIDFVKFSERSRHHYDSVLIIRTEPLSREFTISHEIRLKHDQLDKTSLFVYDIPQAVSSLGPFKIKFREYSGIKGYWGAWDMVLTNQPDIPPKMEAEKPELPVEDKIL